MYLKTKINKVDVKVQVKVILPNADRNKEVGITKVRTEGGQQRQKRRLYG